MKVLLGNLLGRHLCDLDKIVDLEMFAWRGRRKNKHRQQFKATSLGRHRKSHEQ